MAVQFSDSDDLLDICWDNVFKAVFTRETPTSRGALSGLLSAVIGRPLTATAIRANEPPVGSVRERQIRFDVSCKFGDGGLANVEMTIHPDEFEPVRLEYYASKLFIGQDIRGVDKTFNDLRPAYQIAFLVSKAFFADAELVHRFEYYDPQRRVTLGGRSRIIAFEFTKLEGIVAKPVSAMSVQEKWSVYFRYLTDKTKRQKINEIVKHEEGIDMASEVLLTISKDERERARLLSEYKYEADTQSKMVQARRKGLQEGRQEGEYNKAIKVALAAKRKGADAEFIASITGLSLDEIASL
jgi:predicted transposase/invertase (TIGR01784 family)